MARIKTYALDSSVSSIDKVIGTDGDPGQNYGATKNFTVADLAGFIGAGSTGTTGASAYDIWISQGNTGTMQDFLNSLIGAAGSQGATGAAGPNGTNGSNGTNGADGTNGSNGTNGTNGTQGAAGADGTSITIQGTKATVGDLPASGALGDLWIIDQTGSGATAGDGYVWTAGNVWLNIGPLRGPQGIQGVAGDNGTDGAAGAAGTNGVDGTNGVAGAAGAQGIQGAQGAQGAQGIQGNAGTAGSTTELLTFTPGILWSDGTSPVIVASAGKVIKTEYSPGRYIYKFQGDVTFDSTATNGNALNNTTFKVTASNISDGESIGGLGPVGAEYGNLVIEYNVSQVTTFSLASSNLRPAFHQSTATTAEWKTRHSVMNLKDNTFDPGISFNMTFVNGGNVRIYWESTLTD